MLCSSRVKNLIQISCHVCHGLNMLNTNTLLNNTSVIHMKEISFMINLSYYSVPCCSHPWADTELLCLE